MLLGWPEVELVGITTTADPGGRRAGYVAHCLQLAGRADISVAAGAEVSLTTLGSAEPNTGDERYWPATISPRPSPPRAALDLLERSIQQGTTVVAIGPWTNLALLEVARPGRLARVRVVVMGGWTQPPDAGLSALGPEMDWSVQFDTRAAQILAATTPTPACPMTWRTFTTTRSRARSRPAGKAQPSSSCACGRCWRVRCCAFGPARTGG
jgi:purine nucleosidase